MDEFCGGRCWRSWRDDHATALCISSSLGRPWSWTKQCEKSTGGCEEALGQRTPSCCRNMQGHGGQPELPLDS